MSIPKSNFFWFFVENNPIILYNPITSQSEVWDMSENEQKIIFSRNLLKLVSAQNKTQKEVADAIGVSPQTFNTWCQGIALPRMGKVQ